MSFAITRQPRVSSPALKEQFVVLLAFTVGWLLLAPHPPADQNATPVTEPLDQAGVES